MLKAAIFNTLKPAYCIQTHFNLTTKEVQSQIFHKIQARHFAFIKYILKLSIKLQST